MKITSARSWVVKVPWDDNPGADEPRDPIERTFVFIPMRRCSSTNGPISRTAPGMRLTGL
ncbi:MAG TPA: hypothetical protein EYM69_11470 [Dehalococcoidia bacterium]|nr:hypothetical protein [Dehalococcoidia bacterium]